MNSEIVVSILCITYNQEKYISECLDSLVNQNCSFPFEILVHDDASTDSTREIVKRYSSEYPEIIRPLFQIENQYSKGIDIIGENLVPRTRGKYIAFCEGDDHWCDYRKIEEQVAFLESNDCVACISKVLGITTNGALTGGCFPRINEINEGVLQKNQFVSYLLNTRTLDFQQFQLSGLMVKKDILENYHKEKPLFYQLSLVGDFPLFLYIGTKGNVYYHDKAQSNYRRAAEGSWNQRNKSLDKRIKHYECEIKVVQEFNRYTNNAYEQDVEISVQRRRFKIYRLNHDIKSMKSKEMRPCYSMLSKKQKIIEELLHYCPWIEPFLNWLKKWG